MLYALQNLDCGNYFLDFVKILSEGTFESSEMALELIEKYEGDVDYATRLRAINFLEEHEKRIRFAILKEPDKFDRTLH